MTEIRRFRAPSRTSAGSPGAGEDRVRAEAADGVVGLMKRTSARWPGWMRPERGSSQRHRSPSTAVSIVVDLHGVIDVAAERVRLRRIWQPRRKTATRP